MPATIEEMTVPTTAKSTMAKKFLKKSR